MVDFGEYRISQARVFDASRIHRLEQAIFPQDAYPLLEIGMLLLMPRAHNFKALAPDGTVVGFISGSKSLLSDVAWIVTLGVATEHQRRGLGGFLLEWCEGSMKANRVRLSVRASNNGAIALYEKTGYVTVGHYWRYYNDGEDGLVMEKQFKR